MKATKEEQLCVEYANEVRAQNAPELSYLWFVQRYSSDTKKALATKIMKLDPPFDKKEVVAYYKRDNEVSREKTFSQLWNTKGLRNYGVGYLDNVCVPDLEMLGCLQFWFCILYNKKVEEFEAVVACVKAEINESIKGFHDEHSGGYISPVEVHHQIPEKIDALYGNYLKGDDSNLSQEEPLTQQEKSPLIPKKSKEQYFQEYPDLEDFDLPF